MRSSCPTGTRLMYHRNVADKGDVGDTLQEVLSSCDLPFGIYNLPKQKAEQIRKLLTISAQNKYMEKIKVQYQLRTY